jgi:hypothetical protein
MHTLSYTSKGYQVRPFPMESKMLNILKCAFYEFREKDLINKKGRREHRYKILDMVKNGK